MLAGILGFVRCVWSVCGCPGDRRCRLFFHSVSWHFWIKPVKKGGKNPKRSKSSLIAQEEQRHLDDGATAEQAVSRRAVCVAPLVITELTSETVSVRYERAQRLSTSAADTRRRGTYRGSRASTSCETLSAFFPTLASANGRQDSPIGRGADRWLDNTPAGRQSRAAQSALQGQTTKRSARQRPGWALIRGGVVAVGVRAGGTGCLPPTLLLARQKCCRRACVCRARMQSARFLELSNFANVYIWLYKRTQKR